MAIQSSFVVLAADANVQVYRSANGDLTAIGNPVTPGAPLASSADFNKSNLVIQFAGALYLVVAGEVFKFNPATQDWESETLPAFTIEDEYQHTGFFYARNSDDDPILVVLLVVDDGGTPTYQALTYKAGGSWTLGELGPEANAGPTGFLGKSVRWRSGRIVTSNARDLVVYTPNTDTWHVQTVGAAGSVHLDVSFARARSRLFAARQAAGGANTYLNVYEYVAGTWTLVVDGSTSSPALPRGNNVDGGPGSTSGWSLLHYDNSADALIIHGYQDRGAAARGWFCASMNLDTYVLTDRTARVPVALRFPNGPDSGDDVHFQFQVYNEDTPASAGSTIWLALNNGPFESYAWNGVGSDITLANGSQGDRSYALSQFQQGGGEFVYHGSSTTSPAVHFEEIKRRLPIVGGVRVYFRGYTFDETGGSPTSVLGKIGLWYARLLPQAPNLKGTLSAVAKFSGAGATPVLAGGLATNCTFDGSSTYSADWAAVTSDSFVAGDDHLLMLRSEP